MKIGRFVLTMTLVAAAAATAFAQRGGNYRAYGQSSSSNVPYDGKFVFVRMSYPDFSRAGARWAHDYPVGEQNFLKILTAISNVSAHVDATSVMAWSDPDLFKFPVAYMVEPGFWDMSDRDVTAFRTYLEKGGFLIVDDFPRNGWANFEFQVSRAFPQARWIQLTEEHPIFNSFFAIPSFEALPAAYGNLGGQPMYFGLFEDNDPTKRMLIIANYQQDLSEFWEYAETGMYMVTDTNEAYKYGVNQFIYGLTR